MRVGRTLPPAAAPIGIREIISGIRGIIRGRKELDRFQSELKEHFGVKHCFLVSSGKAAFTLILLALKDLFPRSDEVLIPAFTCYSVPSSIVRAGLRIRLCDLHPDRLDFDFAELSAMLSEATWEAGTSLDRGITGSPGEASGTGGSKDPTKRLLAVVPTHLFGFPADVPRLRRLVGDPGVTVVEDAAQAMGETWEGRKLGTTGDVSFFSLGRGKAISTVEGGVIVTNREDIAERLKCLMAGLHSYGLWRLLNLFFKAAMLAFLLHPLLFWIPRSMTFLKLGETLFEPHFPILKMSSFQAGLARNWQKRLQKLQEIRKKNVNRWTATFISPGIQERHFLSGQDFGLIRFPVRVSNAERRESILTESARRGLGIMSVYPDSIDSLPELRGYMGARQCPIANSYARELITVPTHNYLTQEDVTEVGRLLSGALTRVFCGSSS